MIVSFCLILLLFAYFFLSLELVFILLCIDFSSYLYLFEIICSILIVYTKQHKITQIKVIATGGYCYGNSFYLSS